MSHQLSSPASELSRSRDLVFILVIWVPPMRMGSVLIARQLPGSVDGNVHVSVDRDRVAKVMRISDNLIEM